MRRDSRMPICAAVAAMRAFANPGTSRLKNVEQFHHLRARFDLGARQIVGIERIDVDDARHVHGNLVRIRRDEERDELARNVNGAARLRGAPSLVQPGDRRQRLGRARLRRQARAHLPGCARR